MASTAYRHLLRSTRIAFQGKAPFPFPSIPISHTHSLPTGDQAVLHAARQEARNGFRKNAALSPDDPNLAAAITHAEDVARFLRENVVQGKKEGEDVYSEFCEF